MDAIQQFLHQEQEVVPVEFVIGGASKVNIVYLIRICFELQFSFYFHYSVDGQVS